jgi:hypothetical protein
MKKPLQPAHKTYIVLADGCEADLVAVENSPHRLRTFARVASCDWSSVANNWRMERCFHHSWGDDEKERIFVAALGFSP